MQRVHSLAVLNIVLSWIASSGQGQTIVETMSPDGSTVVAVYTSPSRGGPAYLATVSTLSSGSTSRGSLNDLTSTLSSSPPLGSLLPTAVPLLATVVSSASRSLSSSNSDDDPSTMTHISSPVAMVAGSLAGSIVIIAALLVFFVARRRKRNRRRLLHDVMSQSWAARLAHRQSMVDSVEFGEGGAGAFVDRDVRRQSLIPSLPRTPSPTSTSKPPRSNYRSSKTRRSSRYAGSGIEAEELELSSRRTSISRRLSPSPPDTPQVPTITVTLDGESDPAVNPDTTRGVSSTSASQTASSPSASSTRRSTSCQRNAQSTSSSSLVNGRRGHSRHGSTVSNESTVPTLTSDASLSTSLSATTTGGTDVPVRMNAGSGLLPSPAGEKERWKFGLGHDGGLSGPFLAPLSPAAHGQTVGDEFGFGRVDELPPAYEDVG